MRAPPDVPERHHAGRLLHMLVEPVHESSELGPSLHADLLARIAEVAEDPEALGPMLEADVPGVASTMRERLSINDIVHVEINVHHKTVRHEHHAPEGDPNSVIESLTQNENVEEEEDHVNNAKRQIERPAGACNDIGPSEQASSKSAEHQDSYDGQQSAPGQRHLAHG